MRAHFLVGAAVLLGAVSLGGEAHAALQCSDYRNMARNTEDLRELRDLRTRANGCSPGVINDIQHEIDVASGATPSLKPETEAPDPSAPPMVTAVSSRIPPTRPLTVGQSVSGNLTANSATEPERGAPYDIWSFQAPAGQRLQVSMSAQEGSQLDTYLVVGRMNGSEFVEVARNDDRGDGTFNSQLRFVPDEAGPYVIRARAFASEQYGAYALMVEPSTMNITPVARPITLGEVRAASLSPDSTVDPDNAYSYDLWTFQAAAGQRLQASMTSETFDTYLVVGRMQNGAFEEIASNDDRGDGTLNSSLRFVPDAAGEYAIRARSYGREQYGDYNVLVQPAASPVAARIPLEQDANAWTIQGELSQEAAGDYEDIEFQAVRGRRYSVRVLSNGFAPILDVGVVDGARLTEVSFYGADPERASNAAEFVADRRGRYILRVSAPALSSGRFDVIITEVR
jgi:hypothetical protein